MIRRYIHKTKPAECEIWGESEKLLDHHANQIIENLDDWMAHEMGITLPYAMSQTYQHKMQKGRMMVGGKDDNACRSLFIDLTTVPANWDHTLSNNEGGRNKTEPGKAGNADDIQALNDLVSAFESADYDEDVVRWGLPILEAYAAKKRKPLIDALNAICNEEQNLIDDAMRAGLGDDVGALFDLAKDALCEL